MALITLFIILGVIAYFLIFDSPEPTMIFSSVSESEIEELRKYLEKNGIRTYAKSLQSQGFILGRHRSLPSLHVVDPKDLSRAQALIDNEGHS